MLGLTQTKVTITNKSQVQTMSDQCQWKLEAKTVAGSELSQSFTTLAGFWYPTDFRLDLTSNGVFVADPANNRIIIWPANSTVGIPLISTFESDSNGIFYGSNSLYVTLLSGVRKYNINGTNAENWEQVIDIGANDVFYEHIFVDAYGNIYVSDSWNNLIVKWLPDGSDARVVAGGNYAGNDSNQLSHPTGVYITNDEALFVADTDNHRIQMWLKNAEQGTTVAGGNGAGLAANQLDQPTAVILDNRRMYMYISDGANFRIQQWLIGATNGRTIAGTGIGGVNSNQLLLPEQLQFDTNYNLFVLDSQNSRVQMFRILNASCLDNNSSITTSPPTLTSTNVLPTRTPTAPEEARLNLCPSAVWNSTGITVIDQIGGPFELVIDSSNTNMYISTTSNLVEWSLNSSSLTNIQDVQLPGSLFIDKNDNLYVIDKICTCSDIDYDLMDCGCVKTFSVRNPGDDNNVSIVVGKYAQNSGLMYGLTVDADGNIYSTNVAFNRIQMWMQPNMYIMRVVAGNQIGYDPGKQSYQLNTPCGIDVDNESSLYVADTNNNRIQKWAKNAQTGLTVAGGHGSGYAINQLHYPQYVIVDNNHNLYISDSGNNRVVRWLYQAQNGTVIAGEGETLLNNPLGVGFDSNYNLYVADSRNDRILRFNLLDNGCN
ncbi:unnamed protein product, partial [Didymodactylos carnosus]